LLSQQDQGTFHSFLSKTYCFALLLFKHDCMRNNFSFIVVASEVNGLPKAKSVVKIVEDTFRSVHNNFVHNSHWLDCTLLALMKPWQTVASLLPVSRKMQEPTNTITPSRSQESGHSVKPKKKPGHSAQPLSIWFSRSPIMSANI
jgi:hypothetical protein